MSIVSDGKIRASVSVVLGVAQGSIFGPFYIVGNHIADCAHDNTFEVAHEAQP